jgi:hypothetical protein
MAECGDLKLNCAPNPLKGAKDLNQPLNPKDKENNIFSL